ncbi:transmembrane protein [methanogenic archaeon ISO4-H5]|nr:transmembrane protein [methanogenic archaeon ISO4-H5]
MSDCETAANRKYAFSAGLALWILILGLAIRLVFAPVFTYPFDIEHWGVILQNTESGNGLFGLTGYFYTPAWGYILGFEDLIINLLPGMTYGERFTDLLEIEGMVFPYQTATTTTPVFNFAMKLPLILVDVLVGYLIYRLVMSECGDERKAAIGFGLWFLCPIVIYMSSVQAQFDCISALLTLLCVLLVRRNLFFIAGVIFTIAALIKFFPAFCIFLLCVYVVKATPGRLSWKNLLLSVSGAVLTALVIFLPQILDGTVMNAFSFVFGRTSEYDLMLMLRTYPFIAVTLVMLVILAIFAWRMDDARRKQDFLVLILAMLSICTIFSPGPQYWIVYLPLLSYYIACRDRNRALLICLIAMAILTTTAAFFNNSFSLLTTASEYLHLCEPQTVISWMHALDTPVFGTPLTQLVVFIVEFIQLIIMILIALFLLSDLGLFDRYNKLNEFITELRTILGGEIRG